MASTQIIIYSCDRCRVQVPIYGALKIVTFRGNLNTYEDDEGMELCLDCVTMVKDLLKPLLMENKSVKPTNLQSPSKI